MNPAASPASSNPGAPGSGTSTAIGPSTTGASVIRRAGEARRKARVARECAGQERRGVPPSARRAIVRHDEAGVGEAAGHRRDADVVVTPHVHLAGVGQVVDIFEVGADGPSPRARRMPRQAKAEREARMAAVGRDHEPRGMRRVPAAAHTHASDATAVDERALDHAVFVDRAPRRDRLADQPVIEHAALDRVPDDAVSVAAAHARRRPAR